jgi:formamidopyrimidine-DNA glycosylase
MPELPEVETVMEGLKPFLIGQKINSIDVRSPQLRIPIPQKKIKNLLGYSVLKLERRAKYILVNFDDGHVMIVHLGMTGTFSVYPPQRHGEIDLDRHDHVMFTTDKNVKIIYRDPRRFGVIDVIDANEISSYPALKKLGPEPLHDDFTADVLMENLKTRKTPIKVAIMDQSVVVGVGNIYASEALFLSGIHPATPANEVTGKKLSLLVEKIKFILRAAIQSGGSTLRDYRRVGGESGYFQFNFSVYDRAGEPCPECDCSLKKTGGIQRIVQAGRSTFFCAKRQK